MTDIDEILVRNDLAHMIEQIKYRAGAGKIPQTKEEALAPLKLSEKQKQAIETLSNAIKVIAAYRDLSLQYDKEYTKNNQAIYKLSLENSKLKTKNKMLENKVDNLINHVELK